MAIKFQYNKTSLQQQQKQLKSRLRALPTIKSKESALRVEVKRTKDRVESLEKKLEQSMLGYDSMVALWNEFDPNIVRVKDVQIKIKRFAGVQVPELENIDFEVRPFSLLNNPSWFMEGTKLLKDMASIGIEAEVGRLKLDVLDHARRKTTQKVNLFEKVQIPGYEDAIRKIKRYLEDEESLSKASQKIMRTNLENKAKERKDL
ncbi:V-type ATP synthase subunit D [Porphyromonadaceae bacterium W3.11]|nr:V-type ATP synthase subunit D [Porphyromonadaceae bacterium W3.11]